MVKLAAPVILRDVHWKSVENEINLIFMDLFYKPVLEILRKNKVELTNDSSAVIAAINSGRIYYADGRLQGKFNAQITKELRTLNGRYNARSKSWSFDTLPPELQIAVAQFQNKAKAIADVIIRLYDDTDIVRTIMRGDLVDKYDKITGKMNRAFDKTLKAVTVTPKLTDAQRALISKEWGENLELYIQDFSEENILSLREQVRRHVLVGGRADHLQKIIQKNYITTKAKATFLARQETSLLMSKMRQVRYTDAGLDQYVWSGVMDERERPDHKALQGKIFRWDDPPITNHKTGARNHPGEDFGCRCLARPLVK